MQKVILGKTGIEVSKNSLVRSRSRGSVKKMQFICCRRHSIRASTILTRQGLILTVKKSWERRFPISAKN